MKNKILLWLIFSCFYINHLQASRTIEHSGQILLIPSNPYEVTQLIFPGIVDDVKYTYIEDVERKVKLEELITGNRKRSKLEIYPIELDGFDENEKQEVLIKEISITVISKDRIYQIRLINDIKIRDHVVKITHKSHEQYSIEDEDVYVYKRLDADVMHYNELFVKFIINRGIIPFYSSRAPVHPKYPTQIKDLYFLPINIVTVGNYDLFFGKLAYDDPEKLIQLKDADWEKLKIYTERPGQVYITANIQKDHNHTVSAFYLYKR